MIAVLHALAPYQGAALALAGYLFTALWMGAAIAALAALVLRAWKPLDAAARYAVWYVALIAVVIGPLASSFAVGHVRIDHGPAPLGTSRVQPRAAGVSLRPPVLVMHRAIVADKRSPAARAEIAVPPLVAYGVAGSWLLVVLVGVVRFCAGAVVLARLKRDALPLSAERRAALPLWQSHAGAAHARAARLCVSDRVDVPVAVGLFDGMVVIPQHVADAFDPRDVDRFVLHELAHLERRDDWTTVVQRLVQVVMFFNPAVHVITRRLDLEREIACDDRVIAATSDARSYAVGLTRMAESTAWPHRGIAAPAIFVTRKQLSVRVEELLTRPRLVAPRRAFAPAAVAFAASLGVIGVGTFAPALALTGPHGGVNTAVTPGAFQRAKIIILERRGKKTATMDVEDSGVLTERETQNLRERLRALGAADAENMPALLDALNAATAAHGTGGVHRLRYTTTAPKTAPQHH